MALFESVLSSVSIQTVVLLFILFLLASLLLKSNNLPPGPRGWPIIGSTPHIDSGHAYLTFDNWAKKFGDMYTVQLGWTNTIVLNNVGVVKNALKHQGEKFVDRPVVPMVEKGFTIPGSLAFDNGHAWNERRRWIVGAIRNFCVGKKELGNRINLENRINIEADYLCQEVDKHGDSFNPFYFVNNAVSNIVCTVSFGDRFEYSDPQFKELIQGIQYLFNQTTLEAPGNVFPILLYTPMYKHFREVVSFMKAFIDDIIHQHQKTFDPADIRDLIDAYIVESRKDDVDPKVFSKDILWRTIFDLFNAGTDTTSSTILWVIVYLLNYPEVQEKVQNELDEVIGQEKKPTWSDRHSMPFLEATIMEVQRISNAVPITIRSTTEKVEIHDYTIPAGTPVIINIWSVHRHSDHWERPLNFEPERFLSDDRKTIKKQEAFIPFGAGRRSCIGDLMARMEIFLFTANLIQRFTFKVPEGKPIPSVDDSIPGLTRAPMPFEICAVKR